MRSIRSMRRIGKTSVAQNAVGLNAFKSYNIGSLPEGCRQCVKGYKSVIFITGRCPRTCFFCPVAAEKMYNDNMYCNEQKCETFEQIIEEVRVSKSKGAGITGGDPLCALKKTCDIIRLLKKEFGAHFHIHLYTSLNLVNEKNIQALADAGLDEFRVHPDLYDKTLWPRISIPKGKFKKYGIEVPVIPYREKALEELIDLGQQYIDYINLNELEASCKNAALFIARGLQVKQLSSYAIVGSQELGLRLAKKFGTRKFPIHYCTCKLKDAVQLANRLKRRAHSIKRPLDFITTEGTLYFGEVYIGNHDEAIKIMERVAKKHKIPARLYDVREDRIVIASWVLIELANEFPGKKLLVTQYPTADAMRVQEEEIGQNIESAQAHDASERIIYTTK